MSWEGMTICIYFQNQSSDCMSFLPFFNHLPGMACGRKGQWVSAGPGGLGWGEKVSTCAWEHPQWTEGSPHALEADRLGKQVYQSALSAITKYRRLDGLNSRNLSCHTSGDRKSKTPGQQDWSLGWALSLGCRWTFSLCMPLQRSLLILPLLIATLVYWIRDPPHDLT